MIATWSKQTFMYFRWRLPSNGERSREKNCRIARLVRRSVVAMSRRINWNRRGQFAEEKHPATAAVPQHCRRALTPVDPRPRTLWSTLKTRLKSCWDALSLYMHHEMREIPPVAKSSAQHFTLQHTTTMPSKRDSRVPRTSIVRRSWLK